MQYDGESEVIGFWRVLMKKRDEEEKLRSSSGLREKRPSTDPPTRIQLRDSLPQPQVSLC